MLVTRSFRKLGLPLPSPHCSSEVRSAHHDFQHPYSTPSSDTSTSTQYSSLARQRQYQQSQLPPNARNQIFSNSRPPLAFAALFHRRPHHDFGHPWSIPYPDTSTLAEAAIAGTLQVVSGPAAVAVCLQLWFSTYQPCSSLAAPLPQYVNDDGVRTRILCFTSESLRMQVLAIRLNLSALCGRQARFSNAHLCTSTTPKTTSDRMQTGVASARAAPYQTACSSLPRGIRPSAPRTATAMSLSWDSWPKQYFPEAPDQ
jgi:hypothetical protein